jgi:hypothetical protein
MRRNERGIALITVLLLAFALSALALGAAMMSMNTGLIRRYNERFAVVTDAALAGLEEGRSKLNGTAGLYPDSGYVTLENGVAVRDANNTVIPGLTRWTWAGPSGISSGQYGIFGSIISRVTDNTNIQVVRRLEITQSSFAKYAYFSTIEGTIVFGGGDQITGPLHSNDDIEVHSSGARFRDEVRTAGTVVGAAYGTFDKGYTTGVPPIPMPTMTDLTKLRTQAQAGNTYFTGYTTGNYGEARTRIEFVAVDLNNNGSLTDDDEGFIRVYQGVNGNEPFVSASRPGSGYQPTSTSVRNCGDWAGSGGGTFLAAASHTGSTSSPHNHTSTTLTNANASLNAASSKCYLGGDPNLTNGWVASNGDGAWLPWTGAVDSRLVAKVGASQATYYHPITRALNPNFKGVIYVDGKVVISGTVRGRVTLVSPSQIIIGDDVKQSIDPSLGICDDILGLFSGDDIVVADNMLNTPLQLPSSSWKTMKAYGNQDEYIHAVILALDIFTANNYNAGPQTQEACDGSNWGRGCLRISGGLIQRTRGAVGTTAGYGYLKRYTYNTCGLSDPPPYFPTTGYFSRNRFYEINPIGFNVASWFATYQQ